MEQRQLNLFPTENCGDHSFEFKRARKAQVREDQIGKTDLLVILPRRYVQSEFAVSRRTGGTWFCQDHHPDANCSHIKALKELLRVKPVGYTDVEWLRKVLPVGEVK
ncbi:MAG: hypothetical protein KBE65_23465 [Phycisphaerae bacterium]|nr:hypothetical protein [Phycisphaerae bacterium]